MARLHIDIETFSEVDLRTAGAYRYAEDPSTEILCVAYALDDGPVEVWETSQSPIPPRLVELFATGDVELHAHNSNFERTVLNAPCGRALGFPPTSIHRWRCTMAQAQAVGLPGGLKEACNALGTEKRKDEEGRRVMLKLSKPRRPSKNNPAERWTRESSPEDFDALLAYCVDDVEAERSLANALPSLSDGLLTVHRIDQEINDRGCPVDFKGVLGMEAAWESRRHEIKAEVAEITGGVAVGSVQAVREWLDSPDRGSARIPIPNLQAPTVKRWRERISQRVEKLSGARESDGDGPARTLFGLLQCDKVLELFSAHQSKAPAKLTAMRKSMGADGRLRGMFRFHGAATGRWSSRIVQLQNLMRPVEGVDVDAAIEAVSGGEIDAADLRERFGGIEVVTLAAACIRGMVAAPEGKSLVWVDFGQIEARVLAWLAGADDRLELFRTGGDFYSASASKILGKAVSKDDPERQIGKVAELALGYQGAVGAFSKMAHSYGLEMAEDEMLSVVKAWRRANPEIAGWGDGLWAQLRSAAAEAVANPGVVSTAAGGRVKLLHQRPWLKMRLPSGRVLHYLRPEVCDGEVTYEGIDTYTRQWARTATYGGKLTENLVQATACDILMQAIRNVDRWLKATGKGAVVGHVHDEILVECPTGDADEALEKATVVMETPPGWAKGLPLAAEGQIARRFGK